MRYNWIIKETPAVAGISRITDKLQVSEFLTRLLWARGMETPAEMDRFLSPWLRNLAMPEEIPGLTEAADVLARGLESGLPMAVWGDYDVDGVTSSALVKSFLAERGLDCRVYIPSRQGEGYGLNTAGIETLAAEGIRLLLTVDCGVTNVAEIARANELGMTVVVSDHHMPGPELPPAAAVCNPRLAPCSCEKLAGVGVAFLLMGGVNQRLSGDKTDMRAFLDLVALGTIADVVGLTGHNRILAKNGLLLIKETVRPGIAALKEVSGYDPLAPLTAGQVGFGLAPRINAAGRMDSPRKGLDLLLATSRDEALPLARELDEFNAKRRAREDEILQEALAQAEVQAAKSPALVLFQEDWHPGIIGIVASRVAEAHYRPTLMVCLENDQAKASGRSIKELDLFETLSSISDIFTQFGGHKQAAGCSFDPARVEELTERFARAVAERVGDSPLTPTLTLDAELPFSMVTHTLLKELELLQPFGMGNPEPVFASPPVEVLSYKIFGKNHVKLDLRDPDSGVTLQGKAWRMAEYIPSTVRGRKLRFAYTPRIDTYNNIPSIEARIRDWKEE